ncbi:hypothetical protein H310_08990 [Aphanomyces invadans]|uniref:Dipeptidase n=1 Tax=Aphanomyces invadans TaxID=157072 RepID=A0A024TW75_9STRA|nr:hypothetical protein H310_08990 [Aphanomyces invadans]ETV98278.1 hypothetical protein H310_08990 [Aphanomyces invadans]|eukprot:XP_008873153.1 hypothetical protein H310_08990 [Aphanomyces invadans]
MLVLTLLTVLVGTALTAEYNADRCTVLLVGAKASATGTPMTTHTADSSDYDFRIAKVPRQQHAAGSHRNIPLLHQVYPRFVGRDRGAPEYYRENVEAGFFNWTDTPVIGTIPQVDITFGYIDGMYPIMNEHQLAFGESTCGAKLWAKPATQGGSALFDITELARVALERTKTARAAIQLMGDLAVQYGYYGAEWEGDGVYSEAGETLTVTDTKEGWVFHILPDDTGASAVWVAQRVPDTHIVAIGNQFIIHQVNLTDTANFLGSTNLYDVAKRNNFWDGKTDFDFTLAYASPLDVSSSKILTRRQWRVLTLANPTLALSPDTDVYGSDYPFSVETAGILTVQDIMRMQRDHYENTPFDLTQGLAAGPYGNPDRFALGDNVSAPSWANGHRTTFERPISYHTTSYSYVTSLHPTDENHALIWFGAYVPHATAYVPIYAKVSAVPALTNHGSLLRFDFNVSYWLHAVIGNYAGRFYKHAMPAVAAVQKVVEDNAFAAQADVQAKAVSILATDGEAAMVAHLTASSDKFAKAAHDAFYALFLDIVTRFHDGWIFSDFATETMRMTAMGYPSWWLEEVGYYGPRPEKSAGTGTLVLGVVTAVALMGLCFWLGRRSANSKGYASII